MCKVCYHLDDDVAVSAAAILQTLVAINASNGKPMKLHIRPLFGSKQASTDEIAIIGIGNDDTVSFQYVEGGSCNTTIAEDTPEWAVEAKGVCFIYTRQTSGCFNSAVNRIAELLESLS